MSKGYDYCPQYHLIRGSNKYDPSGPIFYQGKWHVFEDSCAWCHYVSTDLLHWTQLANTNFDGLTGSITAMDNGQFAAFWPKGDQSGIVRSISNDSLLTTWTDPEFVIAKPNADTKNYRDPLRPLIINGI